MTRPARALLLRWAAGGLYYTGLIRPLARAFGDLSRVPAFQILTYHRVNDEGDPFFPAVPTAIFEQQVAYMARTYRVLTVEELAERMQCANVPHNALAITFDDGYRDNLTHAAPVLARYGVPATIFLATGFIGSPQVPWFDRLASAFKSTQRASIEAPWDKTLVLGTRSERLQALHRTVQYLKRLSDDEVQPHVNKTLHELAATEQDGLKDLMLSWEEVSRLEERGFSIGAHTVNHPILSRVGPERAWAEIVRCREMIAAACGRPPRAFAYPNGGPEDYTPAVKDLVRGAGFTCAATTRFGVNTPDTCAYELRRGGPWEEHLPTYALKLAWYRHAPA